MPSPSPPHSASRHTTRSVLTHLLLLSFLLYSPTCFLLVHVVRGVFGRRRPRREGGGSKSVSGSSALCASQKTPPPQCCCLTAATQICTPDSSTLSRAFRPRRSRRRPGPVGEGGVRRRVRRGWVGVVPCAAARGGKASGRACEGACVLSQTGLLGNFLFSF